MLALDEILQGALSLDEKERATLAERLLASLDDFDMAGSESLWIAEAERRLADCQSNPSATVSAESVATQAGKLFK